MTTIETTEKPAPATDVALIPGRVAELRASFERGKTRPLAWRRGQLEALEQLVSEGSRRAAARARSRICASRRWKPGVRTSAS